VVELAEGDERGSAYAQLAGFYFRQERVDEAKAVLQAGIDADANKLDLIYLLARFEASAGNQAAADALIEQATEAAPDDPRPYLVLSSHLGRKGDTAGALRAAEDAVRVAPDNQQAKLRKAEVLVEMGYGEEDPEKIAEGRRIAEEVLAAEPSNAGAMFVKAKIEMAEKDLDAAIATLRSAIDSRPDWAQAHFVLGTALAVKGDRTAARTELARALEIDASLTEAHQVLAQVHAGLGEHEYAIEEARFYLRERPDAIPMRIVLAQSLVRLRQPDEALGELRSIPEDERTPEVHYAIGKILLHQGKFDEARPELEAALAALPGNADVLQTMMGLDRRQGRFEESSARIAEAVAADPENPALQRLSGRALLGAGKGPEAEAAFKRAVELAPDDVESYQLLAGYYEATGRTQQTIETFEAALAVDPNAAHIHHFLGVLYEGSGQRDKAIEHYEAAIRVNPNLAEAKNNLAYLFAEGGDNLDRALDLAQEAKALLPENPSAADTLGWVLFKRGVPSAAVTYLKEAEAGFEPGDPSLGVVRVHLAQALQATGDKAAARAALERALASWETQREEIRLQTAQVPPDPAWARSARSMLETL
jgi:tetratricopeptide (TPR) repeat protein